VIGSKMVLVGVCLRGEFMLFRVSVESIDD